MHRRTPSRLAAALATLATLAFARASAADPPAGARLAWVRGDGADACPASDEVAADVRQRLGRDPFVSPAALSIEAVVAREGATWTARIFVRDARGVLVGSRPLDDASETCAPIAAAAALAIALSIDPDAALRPAPPPPPPRDEPAPPRAPAPVVVVVAPAQRHERAPRASPRPHRDPARIIASARFVLAVGPLPAPAPGVAVGLGLASATSWWGASAGMLYLPEVPAPGAPREFVFGMTSAWIEGCATIVRHPRAVLTTCAGLHAGAVHAVVFGLRPIAPGERFWIAGSAGALFALPVTGALRIELGARALAPFLRHRFVVEGDAQPVYLQPPVNLLAEIGAAVSF